MIRILLRQPLSSGLRRMEYLLIGIAVLAKVAISLVALSNSGFMSDEFLHIEAGEHLAKGYMDFPPLIGLLAWLQNLFHSDTLLVHHLFSIIAGVAILIMAAFTTKQLGGNLLAVVITLSCLVFSPGFAAAHYLFLPVVFEQLFWIICIYFLASWCRHADDRKILYFGLSAALGFLSKYSIGFLFSGLLLAILIFQRNIFRKRALWIGALLFLLIIAPNLWWQYDHRFPVIRHLATLYDTQLNQVSFTGELKLLALFLNPVSMVLWIPALLVTPFLRHFRQYRLLSFTLLFSFVLLVLARGKFYYFMPVILGLIPLGSVFIEHSLREHRAVIYSYLSVLIVAGVLLLPHGLPVLKLDHYIDWYRLEKNEDQKVLLRFDNYYSWEYWDPIIETVNDTYEKLGPVEKNNCLIWGRHYAHAGGMNLLGRKYGLPRAFSFHSSYFEWVPDFPRGITVIAIGEPNWTKQHYLQYFQEVEVVDVIDNPYGTYSNWDYHTIFLCRRSKYTSSELKEFFSNEIY